MAFSESIPTDPSLWLCESSILVRVREEQLFGYYLGAGFAVGKAYNNPFREDYNPSFTVFASSKGTNKLLWKDFATQESGNVFKLVMNLYNLTYRQALMKVNLDFGLGLTDEGGIPWQETIKVFQPNGNFRTIPTQQGFKQISLIPAEWNSRTLDYWERYGLSKEQLEHYNVYPADSVYVEGKKAWSWKDSNPCFCYTFFDYKDSVVKVKAYRPLEKNKACKWLSNSPSHILQGYDQIQHLEKEWFGFITKSLKDVIVLRKIGYYSVAVMSEGIQITKEHLERLKPHFSKLCSFYDNDVPGINAMERNYREHDLPYIKIPEEYGCKDISDFYERFGEYETQTLIDSLI